MLTLWRRLFFKPRKGVSQLLTENAAEMGREALEKAKEGVVAKYIDTPESQATDNYANAASKLITSLEPVPEAVIRLGQLLLIKYVENGKRKLLALTISSRLGHLLDENPNLMQSPEVLMHVALREATLSVIHKPLEKSDSSSENGPPKQ